MGAAHRVDSSRGFPLVCSIALQLCRQALGDFCCCCCFGGGGGGGCCWLRFHTSKSTQPSSHGGHPEVNMRLARLNQVSTRGWN